MFLAVAQSVQSYSVVTLAQQLGINHKRVHAGPLELGLTVSPSECPPFRTR